MTSTDRLVPLLKTPLNLGLRVEPWGEIGAVGSICGERYYWFVKGDGTSMMPGFMVEEVVKAAKSAKVKA